MKIPWKEANEGSPVPDEQYQERFWRRRLDGIGLDMVNKEFLAIEFKRMRDARSNYVERATAVAQEQHTSLLTVSKQRTLLLPYISYILCVPCVTPRGSLVIPAYTNLQFSKSG